MRSPAALWCLLAPAALAGQAAPAPTPRDSALFAVTHVTVVDVATGARLLDRTVVVRGSRIAAVDRALRVRVPAGARVVDGRGKFLIPGLWDMHLHALPGEQLPHTVGTAFPLLIHAGVTGIRDMASPLDTLLAVRARVARGHALAPRLVASGPMLDGEPGGAPVPSVSLLVSSPDEGRRAVDSLAAAGVDFIKVYVFLSRDAYFAIADEAKRRRIPFVGHPPDGVSALEASEAGQHSLEHLDDLPVICSAAEDELRRARPPAPAGGDRRVLLAERVTRLALETVRALNTFDEAKCRRAFRQLGRKGTWLVPTLTVRLPLVDSVRAPGGELRYVNPIVVARWKQIADAVRGQIVSQMDAADRPRVVPFLYRLVRLAHEEGVPILAGTDVGGPLLVPGLSLHRELELLVRAGLPPAAALRTATLNPALFLGAADSLGSIAPGKLADLVLLDADPLADIRNTQQIRAVVANGRYLDRAALDALRAAAERAARAGSGDKAVPPERAKP